MSSTGLFSRCRVTKRGIGERLHEGPKLRVSKSVGLEIGADRFVFFYCNFVQKLPRPKKKMVVLI
jgi:hypothetical protein